MKYPKKKMRHNESKLQQMCVAWFRLQYRELGHLLFAVPNGGARSRVEAAIMKAEGVTSGVTDLILLIGRHGYNALCIEMKTSDKKSKVSEEQKDWQRLAAENGCKCVVCRDFESFVENINGYMKSNMKKDIVICDIDGTIAQGGERLKLLKEPNVDWDRFYEDCFEDSPIDEICFLVEALYKVGYRIVFITGRRESVEAKTRAWIEKNLPALHGYTLLMRPTGDHRHDTDVKPELLRSALSQEQIGRISFILEDRNSMVAKWRELGFRCLQVAEGDF